VKRAQVMLICLAGGLSFLPVARAVPADDNPFRGIIDRNAFNLAPLPPPPDPAASNPPPSNIKLTGIVKIFDKKEAMLLVQDPGPGQKTPESYILGEGERQEQVEVLEIDEQAGSVKLKNAGVLATLTFEKDGVKAPGGGGPPPPPAGIGMPPTPARAGLSAPPGLRQIPPPLARNLRLPQSASQPQSPQPMPTAQPVAGGQPFQAVINPFQNNQSSQPQGQAQTETVSPEVQAILIEKARLEHAAEIQQGKYPPLPPTSLTPAEPTETTQ
jgi:hypothetical protein